MEPAPEKSCKIRCSTCGKQAEFFAEPVGPFCSARCKWVDLGNWLNEEYRISEPLRPDHFVEFESLEGGEELDRPDSSNPLDSNR